MTKPTFRVAGPSVRDVSLTRPDTAGAAIEAAYREAFRDKGAIDHAAFFESFAWLNVQPADETAARGFFAELDGYFPGPGSSSDRVC